ncbi:hypothetical protein CAEBREN_11750 [Caenorhabditis brenneri]|uniref:Uncharacterized protein n=1 Tax=Caenorhabditis brenneri TaxID=135651 RepID=G0NQT6_CAEBE|nr:hypothetical protein CAEBREN_11750 [Caenorhabditis brenneri]
MSETNEVPLPMDSFDSPPTPTQTPQVENQHHQNQQQQQHRPYPQTVPLLEDGFKNLTLVGSIKLYKDVSGSLHIASGYESSAHPHSSSTLETPSFPANSLSQVHFAKFTVVNLSIFALLLLLCYSLLKMDQAPHWDQIPLVKLSWKQLVPLDEKLAGKALSVAVCPVPGCLGWGNVLRQKNAFHRTEEACPVAAHMRQLRNTKDTRHQQLLATPPPPTPQHFVKEVKEEFQHPPPMPPAMVPPLTFEQLPVTEQIRVAYVTMLSTAGRVSSTTFDFIPQQ